MPRPDRSRFRASAVFFSALLILGLSYADRFCVAQVSPLTSYYVPEAGPVALPVTGAAAYRLFRACPNNDGGTSLPNNARIHLVLLNAAGVPVPAVPAGAICALFNGGTAVQGFAGPGADEIIANSVWNVVPLCPDVRCVAADAPSDAGGNAYITFTGAAAAAPGVGVRDATRKWGHYDDVPVFAGGIAITGRLTAADLPGTYSLQLKNMDIVGGLNAAFNQGESVTAADFNAMVASVGQLAAGIFYWRDLDWSGSVGIPDFNLLVGHLTHDCDTPLLP